MCLAERCTSLPLRGLWQYKAAGFTLTEKAVMHMKQKIECPECKSQLKVWIDIDADISFQVSRSGKLSKREVQDNLQSDGRCGLECVECDWEVYGNDCEDDAMLKVIEDADEKYRALRLTMVPRKD